jgi:hypothetical protein
VSSRKPIEVPPGFAQLHQRDPKRAAESEAVFRQIAGIDPLDPLPPEDMPALEKIKIFARAGFLARYAGTPERFESIWAEAFLEEEKGSKK